MEKTLSVKHSNGRASRIAVKVLIYTVMSILAVILVFPYAYMMLRSFMTGKQVSLVPVELIPAPFTLEAWSTLFIGNNYFSYTLRTLEIVGFNLIAIPFSASLVAYGFAKVKFKGRGICFAIMMATMMLPGIVTQLPLYVLFSSLGWLDTILPLTIPNLFGGGAIYIFLIRQYMLGIPYELEEAALLDGANAFRRYFLITLPLCTPVLVFIMVTVFNSCWGDFYGPLLYMSKMGKETLAYAIYKDALYLYVTPDKANLKMAAGTFMSIFPLILFVIFQKQLIEGVSTSALKG
jgi:ABC transporter, permease protein